MNAFLSDDKCQLNVSTLRMISVFYLLLFLCVASLVCYFLSNISSHKFNANYEITQTHCALDGGRGAHHTHNIFVRMRMMKRCRLFSLGRVLPRQPPAATDSDQINHENDNNDCRKKKSSRVNFMPSNEY